MLHRSNLLRWVPALAYAVFLWWLSSRSSLPLPPSISDKLVHGLAFGAFALLLCGAVAGGFLRRPAVGGAVLVFGLCVAYAAVDEVHQGFVPGRTASSTDALADSAGALAAVLLLWFAGSRPRRSPSARKAVVTLLSRGGCDLCEEAEEVLEGVRREIPFRLEKLDVDSDRDLAREYGSELPVVLVDGQKLSDRRVDPEGLRVRLRDLRSELES